MFLRFEPPQRRAGASAGGRTSKAFRRGSARHVRVGPVSKTPQTNAERRSGASGAKPSGCHGFSLPRKARARPPARARWREASRSGRELDGERPANLSQDPRREGWTDRLVRGDAREGRPPCDHSCGAPRPGAMTSQEEASSTLRGFLRDVEERCLGAYDHLVIQNASDIARESDRLRNDAYSQKKKCQGEAIKRPEEEAPGATDGAHRGKHLRMGSADPPPASAGGADGADDADERRRPPPKPKRDPGTKLSGSSEALHAQDEAHSHPCGEDWRRTPPPKPRRNPDTQLSWSWDDGGKETSPGRGRSPAPRDEPEPVYIEMAATVAAESRDRPDESVYEEMKYSDWRPSPRHIPQPFPNLLTHRPPLLVFPPFPPARSPNSDESPLTPVDVTRLSMAGERAGPPPGGSKRGADREERPPARNVTPSGRSSAPPLPCAPSGRAREGEGSPRSRSACPSPVSAARSRTPLSLKRPPPYDALMAGRPPEGRGAKRGGSAPPPDRPAGGRRSGRAAEEFKRLHPLGRSASASGAPSAPPDHPALSQMAWPRGDVTMMETIEKKRVLCGEIKSRRRADKNPGKRDALPAGRRKQPPPYPAAVLWDTAI